MKNLLTKRELEIREKNILIAEFMYVEDVQISELKYHSSWEPLMGVVARIMRENGWVDDAKPHLRHLAEVVPFAYIEDIHDAVYRFCKWWKAKQESTKTANDEQPLNSIEVNRFEAFALFKHYQSKSVNAKREGREVLAESYAEKSDKWLEVASQIEQTNSDGINENLVQY